MFYDKKNVVENGAGNIRYKFALNAECYCLLGRVLSLSV